MKIPIRGGEKMDGEGRRMGITMHEGKEKESEKGKEKVNDG